MNIRRFLILICCVFLRISQVLADDDALERAFYAISSLRYYFEEKDANFSTQDLIVFDDEDVDALWETASGEPSIHDELQTIRADYYQALAREAQSFGIFEQQLKDLWEKLQQKILPDDNSKWEIFSHPFYAYPNFHGNPHITTNMRYMMKPYRLPLNHPLKQPLDTIFSQSRATENEQALANAGFVTICAQQMSFIRVARHPLLPGHLVKLFLDNETRQQNGIPGWRWLVDRCKGAENVRKLIKLKNLKYFTVPDKWIYPLPAYPAPTLPPGRSQQPVVLVVTDMKLVSHGQSSDAWRNKITTKHLDELFCILSHGYASCYLASNIPYTQKGTFACIDTEYPQRNLRPKYKQVKRYLSPEMYAYWQKLVKKGGKI